MPRYEFNKPRLFVDEPLQSGVSVPVAREQANYLRNVLRLEPGAEILVFNGNDGEWRARLAVAGRKSASLEVDKQLRVQSSPADLDYVFAPLKHARLDYMVQKAVEMGVSRLLPAMTRRTQVARVNLERMRANVVEAAEQCGILSLPQVCDPAPLARLLETWPADRLLVFCDEDEAVADPVARLRALAAGRPGLASMAVLIGPEGGFDPAERRLIRAIPQAIAIASGDFGRNPCAADTAAVAALAVVQAALGDWSESA